MTERVLRPIVNAAKGSLIGAANVIPGVSGGTIAVIVSLYDGLIAAVSGFFRTGWRRNTAYLLPISIGIGIGLLVFARVVDYLLTDHPVQTAFFFMGLILGSGPFLVKTALREPFRPFYLVPFLVCFGLLAAMAVTGEPPHADPVTELTAASALRVFLTGIVGSATMVIPGVSGSFVMLLMGMYSTFIRALRDVDLAILAVFAPGFLLGLVGVSKAVHYLLGRFHGVTYWGITGLVLGSVLAIWPRTDAGAWIIPSGTAAILTGIAAFVAGFLGAFFLGSGRRDPRQSAQPG